MSQLYRFADTNSLLAVLTTLFVASVYVLSTNGIFIPFAGFAFNPSKLFVLLFLPGLLLFARWRVFPQEDFLFFMFISLALAKALVFQDTQLLTNLSNFLVPFSFYLITRSNLNRINLRLLVFVIMVFATLHAGFGLLQFVTGDKALLLVEETNEFKLKYAIGYSFNPFDTLSQLPHGLYGYSSVLAISLIFPLFLAAGAMRLFRFPIAVIAFAIIGATVFLCFSRFEILSALLLLGFGIFVVKDGRRILFWRLVPLLIIVVGSIALYVSFTHDAIGSVSARVITSQIFDALVGNLVSFVFGVPSIVGFLEKYGFNIPHNMYFFVWIAYGLISASFLLCYLWWKAVIYVRFYNRVSGALKVRVTDFTVYIYVLLFLLFLLCIRAFDYYIVDGYENILLFFYCFIILDKVMSSHHQFALVYEKEIAGPRSRTRALRWP